MKKSFALLSLGLALVFSARAATPPPEALLPADTLVLFTIPDLDKTRADIKANPASQLYQEPAMQPFVKKFLAKWNSEVVAPMEREMGVKFSDYLSLARGQLTFAVVRDGWEGKKGTNPAMVLIIDSKDKEADLKKKITELRQRWTDTGKQVKTEQILGKEFYTIVIPPGELEKTFTNAFPSSGNKSGVVISPQGADKPDGKPEDKAEAIEVTIGQSGPLFLMGNSKRVLEKVVAKQGGGILPVLGEVPSFESLNSSMFRGAMFYGWVNVATFYDLAMKEMAAQKPPVAPDAQPSPIPSPDKIMDALGLRGLKTFGIKGEFTSDGSTMQFHLGVPQDQRKGIFQILVPEAKDSSPPAFVPAEVTKFMRWRLDGQKLWATIESTVNSISPQMGGFLQMTLGAAGKDKDPNFDLKKQLIGNLGDDLVTYEKAPTGTSLEELSSPPSITLVGSPNADQLLAAIQTGTGFLSPAAAGDKPMEREFLGKKIYTLPLPPTVSPDGKKPVERSLMYASSGGYVAFSTTPVMVEEFIRSAQGGGKPLSATPGLAEAAQKVGGMSSGLLIYENQTTTTRLIFEALRKDPTLFDTIFARGQQLTEDGRKKRAEWLDFSLLPEFSAIEKYFHFSVAGFVADEHGINYRFFAPTPPKAK